jgi:enoyl-CoA hydratase
MSFPRVPASELLLQALVHARRLAEGPAVAIRWTKMALNQHLRHSMNLTMDAGLATELLSIETEDAREAGKAFIEKRSPNFQGR